MQGRLPCHSCASQTLLGICKEKNKNKKESKEEKKKQETNTKIIQDVRHVALEYRHFWTIRKTLLFAHKQVMWVLQLQYNKSQKIFTILYSRYRIYNVLEMFGFCVDPMRKAQDLRRRDLLLMQLYTSLCDFLRRSRRRVLYSITYTPNYPKIQYYNRRQHSLSVFSYILSHSHVDSSPSRWSKKCQC